MLGVSIGIKHRAIINTYNALTLRYKSRVLADGGVVEGLDCVNSADFISNNWAYYFRVIDDGGVVESLECVII